MPIKLTQEKNNLSSGDTKYGIDNAIQKAMLRIDKSYWNIIIEVQNILYEEFDIQDKQ